jgi:hypothetical protein
MNSNRPLAEVRWVQLPVKQDTRGEMVIIGGNAIPFSVARLFYVFGVGKGMERGGHAHRRTLQFVLATSGSFKMDLTDGFSSHTFVLDNPRKGIFIPVLVWDRLYDFSKDAVCMVLASTQYDESDYIRDWSQFQLAAGVDR